MDKNKLSENALMHVQEISKWYKEHGMHLGPLYNENRHAYEWLMWCRRNFRDGTKKTNVYLETFEEFGLPKELITDELGLQQSHVDSITTRCDQLREFYEENGHYRVPLRYENGLGKWMQRSRELFAEKPSHPRVKAILEHFPKKVFKKIATKFNDKTKADKVWNGFFDQLKAYKEEHGHTNVPRRKEAPEKMKKLGLWVYKQRVYFKNETLKPERHDALISIGFKFNPREK